MTNTTGTDFDDIAEYLYLSQIAYEGIPQYDIIFTSLIETYLVSVTFYDVLHKHYWFILMENYPL